MKKINHNSLCETETHKVGMTDNEIIKALECCSYAKSTIDCRKCPYYPDEECVKKQCTDILNIINRQKAEIEKLNVDLVGMRGACESYKMHYENAQAEIKALQKAKADDVVTAYNVTKSEALEEFWNRLSENADTTQVDAFHSAYLIKDEDAENLIKEMTEQRKEDEGK